MEILSSRILSIMTVAGSQRRLRFSGTRFKYDARLGVPGTPVDRDLADGTFWGTVDVTFWDTVDAKSWDAVDVTSWDIVDATSEAYTLSLGW